jgi:hypothetical protein
MQTLINILIGFFAVIGFGFCCGIAFVVLLGSEVKDDKETPHEKLNRQMKW